MLEYATMVSMNSVLITYIQASNLLQFSLYSNVMNHNVKFAMLFTSSDNISIMFADDNVIIL